MKITSEEIFTTSKYQIEDVDGVVYNVIRSDSFDDYFIPEWSIKDEDGEVVEDVKIKTKLMDFVDRHEKNWNPIP